MRPLPVKRQTSPSDAAVGRAPVLRASDPDSALRLRFPALVQRSETLHPTRIEAHARSRWAMRAGRLWLRGLEAHPCPRTGLLMTADLEGPLSPGSGEGQSRKRSSTRRSRCRERERERGSNQSVGLPDLRAHDRCRLALAGARGRRDLVRARSLAALVGRRAPAPSLPQLTVAAKRSISNALPRSRM